MNGEVITVRQGQMLGEVIENLVFDEEVLYMIWVDKELVDMQKLVKVSKYGYELSQGEYRVTMDIHCGDDSNSVLIWKCTKQEKTIYTLGSEYLLDYINGHCSCKEIYINKEGPKTKMDEE